MRAGGKREQLLEVLGGQGQGSNRVGGDGLSGSGIGGFDFLRHFAGLEGNSDARGFGDAHFDVQGFGFREAGLVYHHRVRSRWQQSGHKAAIGTGRKLARDLIGLGVDDLDFGVGNNCAARILDHATDGAGGAALSEGLSAGKCDKEKHYIRQKFMSPVHLSPQVIIF